MYIRLPWESEVKKLLVSRKLGVGFGNGYWGWVKKFEELETGVKKILGLGGSGGGGEGARIQFWRSNFRIQFS